MSSKNRNQITTSPQIVSSTENVVKVSSTSSVQATLTADSNSYGEGPITQVLQVVEKKIRNLEKRKGKLDGYREDKRKGKELNDDQNAAVSKYEEVLGNLEFARELTAQFKAMAIEEEKSRKKQLKKELQERNTLEIKKIASTLEIQGLVSLISTPKVYAGLSNGENGLPKLSKEEIDCLEEFERLITLRRSDFETKNDYEKSLFTSAKHISFVINEEDKQFANTTYKALFNILEKIRASGYFERKAPFQTIITQENSTELYIGNEKKFSAALIQPFVQQPLANPQNSSELPTQPISQDSIEKNKSSPRKAHVNTTVSNLVDSSITNESILNPNKGRNVDYVGFGTFDSVVEVQYNGAPPSGWA